MNLPVWKDVSHGFSPYPWWMHIWKLSNNQSLYINEYGPKKNKGRGTLFGNNTHFIERKKWAWVVNFLLDICLFFYFLLLPFFFSTIRNLFPICVLHNITFYKPFHFDHWFICAASSNRFLFSFFNLLFVVNWPISLHCIFETKKKGENIPGAFIFFE